MPPFSDPQSPIPGPLAIRCEARAVLRVLREYLEERCGNLPYHYTFSSPLQGGIGLEPLDNGIRKASHDRSWERKPVAVIEIESQDDQFESYKFSIALWIRWDLMHYTVVADMRQGLVQRFVVGGCRGTMAEKNAVEQTAHLFNSIFYRLKHPDEFHLQSSETPD